MVLTFSTLSCSSRFLFSVLTFANSSSKLLFFASNCFMDISIWAILAPSFFNFSSVVRSFAFFSFPRFVQFVEGQLVQLIFFWRHLQGTRPLPEQRVSRHGQQFLMAGACFPDRSALVTLVLVVAGALLGILGCFDPAFASVPFESFPLRGVGGR